MQVLSGHPLDTLKVRLQTQSVTNPQFTGMLDCARKTVEREGVKGLFKGMSSPLIGVSAINAVLFLNYGFAKRALGGDERLLTLNEIALAGTVTGLAVAFVESPFDLFKAKMQVQYSSSGGQARYKNAPDVARQLAAQYGLRGLYQGLGATILRNLPGNAAYFYFY